MLIRCLHLQISTHTHTHTQKKAKMNEFSDSFICFHLVSFFLLVSSVSFNISFSFLKWIKNRLHWTFTIIHPVEMERKKRFQFLTQICHFLFLIPTYIIHIPIILSHSKKISTSPYSLLEKIFFSFFFLFFFMKLGGLRKEFLCCLWNDLIEGLIFNIP